MVRLQDEVIRKLTEIAKRNSVSYTEVKGIYSGLFEFLVSEFSQIDDSDPNTWNKNVIIKNFGKFVINKSKLKKAINKVAHKNIKLISQFREKYPECIKCESRLSDKYNKMIIEAMGGPGDNTLEKEEKIMKNIAKTVVINK